MNSLFHCSRSVLCVMLFAATMHSGPAIAQPALAQPAIEQAADTQADTVEEPKLKFNFRFQKWPDVLNWLAEEAGLSLVMDEPPPGTFNYSDSKQYSPTEAIDLVNGWLLTKGYTLVRRERLLMCVNLKDGLPEGTIPRVSVDELAERGRYEFVSVLMSLDGRPAAGTLAEIQPLLGKYGKAEALEATQQLLVADAAGSVRAIRQVVQQVPIPPKPKQPEPKPPEPKPELVVYPIEHANPVQAGEVLKQILDGTVVVDETASQISVNAVPAEQAKAKMIVTQLESNQGPETQPELRLYPARISNSRELLATMELISPDGQFRYDEASRRLIAWARPSDHARIEQSLEELLAEQQARGAEQLEVYPLDDIDPAAARTLLTDLLPDARVTLDSRTGSLIAVASLADHQAIRSLLEQLGPEFARNGLPELQFYPLTKASGKNAVSVLQTMLPRATITFEESARRLSVVATKADHQRLQATLAKLEASAPVDEKRVLKIYDVTSTQRSAFSSLVTNLSEELPGLQVLTSAQAGEMTVWAKPSQHEIVEDVLSQLQRDVPADQRPSLVVYPIRNVDPQSVATVLTEIFPDAKITVDTATSRLLIHAKPPVQTTIRSAIEQLDAISDGDVEIKLMVYPINGFDSSSALQLLNTEVPKAVVIHDTAAKTFIVRARMNDQQQVAELLDALSSEASSRRERTVVVHDIGGVDPTVVQNVLQPLTGEEVQVTSDPKGRRIFVRATADRHSAVKDAIDQITTSNGEDAGVETRSYRLLRGDADEAQEALQALFPDATLVTDTGREVLVATATAKQHDVIDKVVRQMTGLDGTASGPTATTYRFDHADGDTLLEVLDDLFRRSDDVRLSLDRGNKAIVAVARPEQHETIAGLLADLDRQDDSEQQQTEVFQLSFLEPRAAENAVDRMIGGQYPNDSEQPTVYADEALQQLWVRGSVEQLAEVRTLLLKMGEVGLNIAAADSSKRNLRVIPVGDDVDGAIRRIRDLWPSLRRNPIKVLTPGEVTPGEGSLPNPGQFSVPVEQLTSEAIGGDEAIEDSDSPDESSTDVSTAGEASADEAFPDEAFADEAFADEASPVVIVPGEGRVTIASDDTEALDQMESLLRAVFSQPRSGRNRDFSIFQLTNAGATDVAETLQRVFEDANGLVSFGQVVMVPEERLNALIVYAGRADRDRIEQLLQILDSDKLEDTQRAYQTSVLPLQYSDARQVSTVLQGVYRAQMTAGGARSTLTIPRGVPSDVATVLRQINAAASSPLLTIEVQRDTNSLVVKAPRDLLQEVSDLVAELDETSATTRARGIRLLPLKKTNSSRVMKILNQVLD